MTFADRADAGRRLAGALEHLRHESVVVAALVRGGVPVGAEVARALGAPLEVLVVRKVGAPSNPEYGIGAVAEDGHVIVNETALQAARVSEQRFEELAAREREETTRRVHRYRGGRERVPFTERTVVLVDDGLATGVTARLGVECARRLGARRVVLAAPVGAPQTVGALREVADEVVVLEQPPSFRAVGTWYGDFHQVSDDEVISLLTGSSAAAQEPAAYGRKPGSFSL